MSAGKCAQLLVGVAIVTTGACVRAVFVPPSGPGTPAPDAAAAWSEATSACRGARTYVAALRVSGRVAADRLWPVSIETAVTSDQSLYLSATAAGRSIFVLAGSAGRATLWLRAEERTVTAAPAEIFEAIMGLPLAPDGLLATLSGCVTSSLEITSAARHDQLISIETAGGRAHLASERGRWRTRAGETDAFTVEFAGDAGGVPKDIWMWSRPGGAVKASLHLTATDVQLNGDVPPTVFQLPPAASGARPMTIAELRAAGPLRERQPAPGAR